VKAARRAALAQQGPGGKPAVCAAPFAPPFQDTFSHDLFSAAAPARPLA